MRDRCAARAPWCRSRSGGDGPLVSPLLLLCPFAFRVPSQGKSPRGILSLLAYVWRKSPPHLLGGRLAMLIALLIGLALLALSLLTSLIVARCFAWARDEADEGRVGGAANDAPGRLRGGPRPSHLRRETPGLGTNARQRRLWPARPVNRMAISDTARTRPSSHHAASH